MQQEQSCIIAAGICSVHFTLSRECVLRKYPHCEPTSSVNSALTVLLSAVGAALFVWLVLRTRHAALAERVTAREEENRRLASELTTLRSARDEIASQLARAQSHLEAERAAHERLTNEFKALS